MLKEAALPIANTSRFERTCLARGLNLHKASLLTIVIRKASMSATLHRVDIGGVPTPGLEPKHGYAPETNQETI